MREDRSRSAAFRRPAVLILGIVVCGTLSFAISLGVSARKTRSDAVRAEAARAETVDTYDGASSEGRADVVEVASEVATTNEAGVPPQVAAAITEAFANGAADTPEALTALEQDATEEAPATVSGPGLTVDVDAIVWREENRRCGRRNGGRFFCDGPRRIPVPRGEAHERALELGLGTKRTYWRLFSRPAEPELLSVITTPAEETLLWPVQEGYLGRGFGHVRTRANVRHVRHDGVDIPAAEGAHVRATNAGIVAYADNGIEGYGNLVAILHSDNTITKYAHLQAAYVISGQFVARGEVIGEVGKTGLARAPHLHFEWHVRSHPRNPERRFVEVPDREQRMELMRAQAERAETKRSAMQTRQLERQRRQIARAVAAGLPPPVFDRAPEAEEELTDEETELPMQDAPVEIEVTRVDEAETAPVQETAPEPAPRAPALSEDEQLDPEREFDLPADDSDFQTDMDLEE